MARSTEPTWTKSWKLNGILHRTDGPALEYEDGTKCWYLDGKPHRTDGPAYEHPNGEKEWYVNGELHRTDGPAMELPSGDKFWYLHGERHRMDGPAFEYADGDKIWCIHGIQLDPSIHPVVENGKFVNGIPTPEQILDVMLNIDREYGTFLLQLLERNG